LKDQSTAIRPLHEGTASCNGQSQHHRAVGRKGVFEEDAIQAEAAQVRDKRIPPGRIEGRRYTASGPPRTGSVQELLVDAHVAVFVGEMVHAVADAFGNRTCSLSASQVDIQR